MDLDHERAASLDRLSDAAIDNLADILEQFDDRAMDMEELDGFLTALHCCPELVPPSEYLPIVLGGNEEDGFPDPETAERFFQLLIHHWNAIGDALASDDVFMPFLLQNDEGKEDGKNWALGFVRGMQMRKDAWRELTENEEQFVTFTPIFALIYQDDPDPKMRPYKEPVTEEQREKLLAGLCIAVREIYDYFARTRKRAAFAMRSEKPIVRSTPKIGRNDPCYCGSGKKYKKCCGALSVN